MRPSVEQTPPEVRCEKSATPEVEATPIATLKEWIERGPAWAVTVLGILTEERQLRSEEHRCLHDLRAQGVIR